MQRKLIAALACRINGSRLYGKPVQNLDVQNRITILDNIIQCLANINAIDEIILGISVGPGNEIFETYANRYGLTYIKGSEADVLKRLIKCGEAGQASDIFRVTTESPFISFDLIEKAWDFHIKSNSDAVFLDDVVDGCGFEIISLSSLKTSHKKGEQRHRSEMCTLYMRENINDFDIRKLPPPSFLERKDLRLTIDNPEDLVICRKIYETFSDYAPNIPIKKIISYLDENPNLIELVEPFLDDGYATMYL